MEVATKNITYIWRYYYYYNGSYYPINTSIARSSTTLVWLLKLSNPERVNEQEAKSQILLLLIVNTAVVNLLILILIVSFRRR